MNIGYLVCSTLRCESGQFSSAIDLVDDTHQDPSGVVESSCSEGSVNSEHPSSTSLDASSSSRRRLRSGHTSPSSLALQRRLPEAPFYLKQQTLSKQTLSTVSTNTSADNSSAAYSSAAFSSSEKKNSKMAIPCAATRFSDASRRDTARFDKKADEFSVVTPSEVYTEDVRFEKSPEQDDQTVAAMRQFCCNPPPLRSQAWSEPSAKEYEVRSKSYMTTRIKEPSKESVFKLITVDLINTETPIYSGMCAHPGERIQLALERERKTGIRELPDFIFAVNLCIPAHTIYHAVFYYGVDKATMDEIRSGRSAFGRIMKEFIFGDSDSFRNQTFKLIPRIVEGNYIVSKAVGTKPAILGKKIKQLYVRGGGSNGQDDDRFFEIIVDIASDPVAKRITKLCLGYIKSIVVDMMFALEGYDESTLPERIFGGATIKNIDFATMDGKRCVR